MGKNLHLLPRICCKQTDNYYCLVVDCDVWPIETLLSIQMRLLHVCNKLEIYFIILMVHDEAGHWTFPKLLAVPGVLQLILCRCHHSFLFWMYRYYLFNTPLNVVYPFWALHVDKWGEKNNLDFETILDQWFA